MEYVIINGRIPDIETDVNNCIKDGFIPLGGIAAGSGGLFQAMTRTCKPNKTVNKSGIQPKAVIDLWNEVTKDSPLPRKLKVIPALEQSIRTRVNEKDGFTTIEAWRSYFTAITRSDFLTGQTPSGNWKASLEWAVKSKSVAGVIEGKYHNE